MLTRIAISVIAPRRHAEVRALFSSRRPDTRRVRMSIFPFLLSLFALCVCASSALAAPTVQLQTITGVVREGGSTNIVLRVMSDAAVTADLTVNFDITKSNPQTTLHYNVSPYSDHVIIPAGASSADITIAPIDNNTKDGHLTLTVALRADPAYTLSADPTQQVSANVLINDDESLPILTVQATPTILVENDNNANLSNVQFSLSARTIYAFDVNYAITGDATRYQFVQQVHFKVSDFSNLQTFAISNDTISQGDQTFTLTLKESPYYVVSTSPGVNSFTLLIRDDDSYSPPANFGLDQVVERGGTAIVSVDLDATPSHYPVQIPYTVQPGTGAVEGTDYIVSANPQLTITSGLHGEIQIPLPANAPSSGANKFIIVRMGEPINARLGKFTAHTIIIAQTNVQPIVSLSAQQFGRQARLITVGGGDVTVTATVSDPNHSDTYTYNWSATNSALKSKTGTTSDTFIFDPSSLVPGYYKVRLTVTDSGSPPLSTAVDLQLQILAKPPDLTGSDTNGDGIPDVVQGFGDKNNNGIPDYLDSSQLQPYELQQQLTQIDRFSIRTRPGLSLSLGDTALANDRYLPLVNTQDIGRVGGGEGQPTQNAADSYVNGGGYYDVTITGLKANYAAAPISINLLSIPVVIPQAVPIPKGAVYREYTPVLGWHNFALDDKNQYFSAPDSKGICPLPGDGNYLQGLTEGHTCVMLAIEDGGPNDGDGISNFVIKNLGGVTVSPDANTNPDVKGTCGGLFCSSSSGSGAIGIGVIALLSTYGWMRIFSRRRARGWQ